LEKFWEGFERIGRFRNVYHDLEFYIKCSEGKGSIKNVQKVLGLYGKIYEYLRIYINVSLRFIKL